MKNRIIIAFAVLFTLVSTSCHRQDLEDIYYTRAMLPVLIDWETKAYMDIANDPDGDLYSASVWLFPTENSTYQGDPLEYKLSYALHDYIEVPVGEYDVLVFNKTVGDYSSNVGFRGTDSFKTFEYYVANDSRQSLFSKAEDDEESRGLDPDLLAAWSFDNDKKLVITADLVGEYEKVEEFRSRTKYKSTSSESTKVTADDFDGLKEELLQLIDVVPERLTHSVTVTESIENIHSIAAAQGTLKGVSNSLFLAEKRYNEESTSHIFDFTTKTVTDESGRNGDLSATFNIIAKYPDQNAAYSIETLFTLVDEYEDSLIYPTPPDSPFSFDVSEQVNSAEIDEYNHFDIIITDKIELPDISVGGGGGFDVSVDDWEDPVIIPIN
ncbi:MAG: DUF5119 domain-containing protein [Rikenellaceae bacterium]